MICVSGLLLKVQSFVVLPKRVFHSFGKVAHLQKLWNNTAMAGLSVTLRAWLGRQGTARSRDLVAKGLTRSEITRLKRRGALVAVGRGVYALPGYQLGEYAAVTLVASRKPEVVFCLLTALRLHDLTTQAPHEIWIAIANKDHPPRMSYPPLRTVHFSAAALAAGVETRKVDGLIIRLTNPARTAVDCFKFRNKIGLDVALEALRETYRNRRATLDQLWQYARLQRVAKIMRPYLESLA